MKKLLTSALACFAALSATTISSCSEKVPQEGERVYTITVGAAENGTAMSSQDEAYAGDQITLTATPDDGFALEGWNVTAGGITLEPTNPVTFTMPAADVVVAPVYAATHKITILSSSNGTVASDPAGAALEGQTVTLTATPIEGFVFASWEVVAGGITLGEDNPTTFTMPAEEVQVRAKFDSEGTPVVKKAPYLLYIANDGKLSAGAWDGDVSIANLLYFKFGSVVGSGASENDSDWNSDKVRFNPTRTTPSQYPDIPYAMNGGMAMSTTEGYYASDEYNTAANLKSGKGDPCRLVGLTAEMVRTMDAQALESYDSGLKILSRAEALRIAGEKNLSRKDHMFNVSFVGAVLPHEGDEPYDASKFLPAAGAYWGAYPIGKMRYAGYSGQSNGAYAYGRYWQDTAVNTSNTAYNLMFGSTVGDMRAVDPDFAFQPTMSCPVRCMVKE